MRVKGKFKFLQIVKIINSEKEVTITNLNISADGSFTYGCITQAGEQEWYREFQLEEIKHKEVGINLDVL